MNVNLRLVLGRKYQLQGSNDLKVWNVSTSVFVAESENVTQEFVVAESGRYFRVVEILIAERQKANSYQSMVSGQISSEALFSN